MSAVVVVVTMDTTSAYHTADHPLPSPATKTDPCVPSPPRAAPRSVLGRGGPGRPEWVMGGDGVSAPTMALMASVDGALRGRSEGGGVFAGYPSHT